MAINPTRTLACLALAVAAGILMGAADHEAITGLSTHVLGFAGTCLVFVAGWVSRTAVTVTKEDDR
ncbi:hypothetical protein [Nocardiopsis lucentensis]|uniref:hypothetical protein n=1 Tax=Nocardiopsis lucentensis TaxID=53441 RepID=UPI0003457803|nr:hypothetical protein [Nocardiopsis lucentensis]